MRVMQLCSTSMDTRYFRDLAPCLAKRGVESTYVSLAEIQSPQWLPSADGARYYCLKAPSRRHYLRAILRLARLLDGERIDILHTHLYDAGWIGIIAAWLAGRSSIVLSRHHMDFHHLINKRFHVAADRWMARRADHVVAVSAALKQFMVEREGIDSSHITVINIGFDMSHFSGSGSERNRIRAEFGCEDAFLIGCVGSLSPLKGHSYLLQAFAQIRTEVPHARLLLLGNGDRSEIDRIINRFNLSGGVIFGGYRDDVASCMKAMDVLVHPSLSESFSQVVIEGMAVGAPVIATDRGIVLEAITNGESGLVVPPANAPAIYEAVMRCYRNPGFAARIAKEGRSRVERKFRVDRMADELLSLYRQTTSVSPDFVRAR